MTEEYTDSLGSTTDSSLYEIYNHWVPKDDTKCTFYNYFREETATDGVTELQEEERNKSAGLPLESVILNGDYIRATNIVDPSDIDDFYEGEGAWKTVADAQECIFDMNSNDYTLEDLKDDGVTRFDFTAEKVKKSGEKIYNFACEIEATDTYSSETEDVSISFSVEFRMNGNGRISGYVVKDDVSYSYSDTSGSYSTESGSEVCEYDISYKFDDKLKLSADEIAKF